MNNITILKSMCLMLMVIIFLGSCQKDIIDQFEPIGEKWADLESFYDNVNTTKKVIVNDAVQSFVLNISEDIYIHFPTESFVTSTGIVVKDEILFEIDNITSNGLAILNNLNTTTIDNPGETLFTKFLLNVKISHNNIPVFVNPAKSISLYFEGEASKLKKLEKFNLIKDDENYGWNPSVNYIYSEATWSFEVGGVKYEGTGIKIDCTTDNWINFSTYQSKEFTEVEDFSTLDVSIPNDYEDIDLYLTYKNKLVVRKMEKKSNNSFSLDNVLINEELSIIALGVKNEKLVFDKYHFVAQNNNHVTIEPEPIDYIALINELKNM